MSLFPRYLAGEFAPFFRLLDEVTAPAIYRSRYVVAPRFRLYQPKFDVRESKDSYQIEGELPGVDRSNLDIEFTDPHTLAIKGATQRSTQSGSAQVIEARQREQEATQPSTVETLSTSSYQKPSVEDASAPSESEGVATPSTSTASSVVTASPATTAPVQSNAQPFRYWVSERSVGEFYRSFRFPSRVDQDAVRASLKNGILSIVVPKVQPAPNKKVDIE